MVPSHPMHGLNSRSLGGTCNATTAQPTFIVPPVIQDTTLTFSLVVTDNNGAFSAPDTVNIRL